MFNKQAGFIRMIFIIFISIIILSYFGFNLRQIVEAPNTQSNLGYVWGFVINVWDNYLVGPLTYLWNEIFIKLLWGSFVDNLQRIKDGQPTTIQNSAPNPNPISP